jgi:CBS-domain-containing membrane protein
MNRTRKPAPALTAADVMRRAPVTVHHRMTLRGAGRVMARWRLHLLPVTDDHGRFVGALTAAEVLGWALDGGQSYDTSAWTDWQVMAPGAGRTDEVRWHLTVGPVVVAGDTGLAEVARRMGECRACCAVVIDEGRRPVGLLSGGDFLAAGGSLAPLPVDQGPAPAPSESRRLRSRRPLSCPVG